MFKRILEEEILNQLFQREIIIVNGPRRIGKTTLLRTIEKKIVRKKTAYFDFTDPTVYEIWHDFSQVRISSILEDLEMSDGGVLFFDEVQYFENIGILLKLFYDHFPRVKIIATGSSSFLFLQNVGDSLAGRKKIFILYPLSLEEITNISPKNYWAFEGKPLLKAKLTESVKKMLLFGAYPEIWEMESLTEKGEKLKEIVDSYLFKDLLMIESIKKPRVIVELAKLLAYQIGSLVNPNEIASLLGISRESVLHYLDLLEKFFIIFRVYPYKRNLRDVIKKKFKVYFYDLGIRNALIGNFLPLEKREDKGFLLENLLVLSLQRRIDYERKLSEIYFWRDYDKREIDILLKNEEIFAYEVKWEAKKYRFPKGNFIPKEVIDLPNSYRFVF